MFVLQQLIYFFPLELRNRIQLIQMKFELTPKPTPSEENENKSVFFIHLKLFHFLFNTHSNIYVSLCCRCICIRLLDVGTINTVYGTFVVNILQQFYS